MFYTCFGINQRLTLVQIYLQKPHVLDLCNGVEWYFPNVTTFDLLTRPFPTVHTCLVNVQIQSFSSPKLVIVNRNAFFLNDLGGCAWYMYVCVRVHTS